MYLLCFHTCEEKVNIIENWTENKILPYLDCGVKAAEVAQEYSLGKATVSNIKKAKLMK